MEQVVVDISGLKRDRVNGLDIYTDLKGRNQALCDSFSYLIRNIRLELVSGSEEETGWNPEPGHIALFLLRLFRTRKQDGYPPSS